MSGVEWGLARPQFNALEALQAYGAAAQQRERQQTMERRQQVGGMAAAGDYTGARAAALSSGDFDIVSAIGGLEQDKYQQLTREFDTIGKLHPVLKQMPLEQRAQMAIPILRQAGFGDQELASFDWSDEAIDGVYALSQSGQAALKQRMEAQAKAAEPYTLAPGAQRMVGGEVIAENNNRPPIWDAESGQLIYPGAYAAPQQQAPTMGSGDVFSRMIGAESSGQQFNADGQPLTSPAGAVGIAQVMPGTAPEAAKLAGLPWDERRYRNDPQYNRALGQAYYQQMLASFGGDEAKAVAAYNAGPGRVRRAIAQGGENWQERLPGETKDYLAKVLGPGVVQVRPPRQKEREAPSGYEWSPDGSLRPIRGGPADPQTSTNRSVQNNRKAEADLRKEFNSLPEVKRFKDVRASREQVRAIMSKPNKTAQDDIALVFSYMKMLDPGSVVREGEYATAQNAASIPDNIRNLYNRAQSGNRLNDQQRRNMASLVDRFYQSERNTYNNAASQYQGYAQDYGIDPKRIARRYVPDQKPQPQRISPDRMRQFRVIR